MLGQTLEDGCDLRRRLALAKHNFRHADSQRAMMINLCEPQVFKGKMTKPLDRIVGRSFSPAHVFEELADGFSVQDGPGRSPPDDRQELYYRRSARGKVE